MTVTNSFLNRLYGIQNKDLNEQTKQARRELIRHTYFAIEEYSHPLLIDILTPVEFLAFLPHQYYQRKHNLAQTQKTSKYNFIYTSIQNGIKSFKRIQREEQLLPGIPDFLEEHTNLQTVQERIRTIDDAELGILQRPAADILTRKEFHEKENNLIQKGSSIDEYILKKNFVLQRNLPRSKTPQMMLEIYQIAKLYAQAKATQKHRHTATYSPKNQKSNSTQNHTIPIHPTLQHILEHDEPWMKLFTQTDGDYDMLAFTHFFEGLLEYKQSDSQKDLLETLTLSDNIVFFANMHFFRHHIPMRFNEIEHLTTSEILEYVHSSTFTQKYLDEVLKTLKSKRFCEQHFISQSQSNMKKTTIDIKKIFTAPKLQISSPNRAKKHPADICVPNYISHYFQQDIPDETIKIVQKKILKNAQKYLRHQLLR